MGGGAAAVPGAAVLTLIVFCDICGRPSDELLVTAKRPSPWPRGWTERRLRTHDYHACSDDSCKAALRQMAVPDPMTVAWERW